MSDERTPDAGHPEPEILERLALEGGRDVDPDAAGHVAGCDRCRTEVRSLRRLHAAFAALPTLEPRAGFTDRVMARIRLPVPWYRRLARAFRERWVAVTAGLAAAGAGAAGAAAWVARYPELTPLNLAGFLVNRVLDASWGLVLELARWLYSSGLVTGVTGFAGGLGLLEALTALATISLVGAGSLRMMMRLMAQPARRLPARAAHGS